MMKLITLLLTILLLLVATLQFAHGLSTVTPTCIGTYPTNLCEITPAALSGTETAFVVNGGTSMNQLTITGPSYKDLTLTLSVLTVNSLQFSTASRMAVELDRCTVNSAVSMASDTPIRSLVSKGTTFSITSELKVFVNQSFSMDNSQLTCTAIGSCLVLIPVSASGSSIDITNSRITATPSSSTGITVSALRIKPDDPNAVVKSITVQSSRLAVTTPGDNGIGLFISASALSTTPLFVTGGAVRIVSNTINVSTGNSFTGKALDLGIATSHYVNVSNNVVGVIAGNSMGLALAATGGNYWYLGSNNFYIKANTGDANSVIINAANNSASLNFALCHFYTHGTVVAVGLAVTGSTPVPSNYELRVQHSTFLTVSSGSSYVITPPASFSSALWFLGNVTMTSSTGLASSTLPTDAVSSSLVVRCSTWNGGLLPSISSALTASYSKFLSCATCSYDYDCNTTTTQGVTFSDAAGETATGRCYCNCNNDSAVLSWLPRAAQCSGGYGIRSASSIAEDPDALPYVTMLGLSVFGLGVGCILLIVLICCLCAKFCPMTDDEEERRKLREEEYEKQHSGGRRRMRDDTQEEGFEGDEEGAAAGGQFMSPLGSKRPIPPKPYEIIQIKKEHYRLLRDKKLIRSYEQEIVALEAAGEFKRAADLRAALDEILAEGALHSGGSSRGHALRKRDGSVDSDDELPDIAITPSEDGAAPGHYQSKLEEERALRARLALISAQPPNPDRDGFRALEQRVDECTKEVHALNDKMRDISPPSADRSPEMLKQQQHPGTSTTASGRSASASGLPLAPLSGGTSGRSASAEMREPFSTSPIEEYPSSRYPRLSRTSPFRFSATPPNHSHDSVGMIATTGHGGNLHVVALRGGDSDEEDSPAALMQQQQQQQRPPSTGALASNWHRRLQPPRPVSREPISGSPPQQQPPPARVIAAPVMVVETEASPPVAAAAAPPEPPRRGSPLRHTAARFMDHERNALSPQYSANTIASTAALHHHHHRIGGSGGEAVATSSRR